MGPYFYAAKIFMFLFPKMHHWFRQFRVRNTIYEKRNRHCNYKYQGYIVRRFWHNVNHLLHCFCKNCGRRRFTKMWPKAKTTLGYKSFAMILYFLASSNTKEDSLTHTDAETTTHLYLHTQIRILLSSLKVIE